MCNIPPKHIKKSLDYWAKLRDNKSELSLVNSSSDPLQIASIYKDEYIALVCALFAYGNAKAIVKFLSSLDFSLLDKDEKSIEKGLHEKIYRFQTNKDIVEFFKTLHEVKKHSSLQDIFYEGYKLHEDVMNGLSFMINALYDANPYRSRGYEFLLGKPFCKKATSPYKRYHMYLRWMVRKDNLDMGLWEKIDKAHLMAPLDTHTHKMALKFGLIKRKTYDFKACLELTEAFREFDKYDPVKYDFALYRLGQEKIDI